MHRHNLTPQPRTNGLKGGAFCGQTGRAVRTMLVFVGLLGCSLCVPASADLPDGDSIWLYNAQGVLVNVTSTTSYSDGDVYNSNGTLIGTVNLEYDPHIYGLSGGVIGIIDTSE
jgi:hypothetical protein